MRLVKGKNTKPEMVVRRLLHADGYRFQVNSSWSDQHEQARLYESKSLLIRQVLMV
ncbi:MAG: hypothetical protein AB7D39_05265 [Pseudodesulfovibrio sp.]|uniref:hypothetical protein n=1 Tax=Pseudodesulfovibrio sp. TaxID=2035812 RepID=UPI003D0D6331